MEGIQTLPAKMFNMKVPTFVKLISSIVYGVGVLLYKAHQEIMRTVNLWLA